MSASEIMKKARIHFSTLKLHLDIFTFLLSSCKHGFIMKTHYRRHKNCRKLLDGSVVCSYDSIVVFSCVKYVFLHFRQIALKRKEVLVGFEVGISFGKGKQIFERAAYHVFGLTLFLDR